MNPTAQNAATLKITMTSPIANDAGPLATNRYLIPKHSVASSDTKATTTPETPSANTAAK